MLILTKLDPAGHIILDHGVAASLHSQEEYGEKVPGQTLDRIKNTIIPAVLASQPDADLAIVKVTYRVIYRNKEPQHPCAG